MSQHTNYSKLWNLLANMICWKFLKFMTLPHKNLLITIVDSFIDSLAFCILSSAYVVNFILQKKLIHSLGLHPKLHLCSEIYYIKGWENFWPFLAFFKQIAHSFKAIKVLWGYSHTRTPHSSLLPHQHGVLLIFWPMHSWYMCMDMIQFGSFQWLQITS